MAARIRTRPLGSTFIVLIAMCLLAGLAGVAIGIRQERLLAAAPGPGPYDVALAVDTNPDPAILETDITAQAATLDVGNGLMAHMWTFNGTVPGPQLRLKVGDTAIIHFKNLLPEPTSIHWHGIELANTSDGTPVTQNQVETNDTFLYKFTVTRPGIYWYHPHHHSSTNHVSRGLYGSMIVTDNSNHEQTLVANGVLPSAAQTKTLQLSDTTVCAASDPSPLCSAPMDHHGQPITPVVPLAAGEIPNIQPVFDQVDEGRTVLTNGVNVGGRAGTPSSPGALDPSALTLDVQAGQGLRLQLNDAATIRYFRLGLTDNTGAPITLFRVGGEGGLLDEAIVEGGVIGGYDTNFPLGEIVIAPGDRADVVAVIPPTATGVLTLWTQTFPRDPNVPGPPTAPVAHFKVNGTASAPYTISAGTDLLTDSRVNAPVEALPAPTANLLNPSAFSPAKNGLGAQNIALTEDGNIPGGLGVDHVQGTHDAAGDYTNIAHMGSTRYAKIGDVLQLTVSNEFNSGLRHPFHLHGFSLQPISFTPWAGAAAPVPTASFTFPYREFIDEIDIPAKYTLTFRVRLDPRPLIDGVTPGGGLGRWMYHCHLFHHSTFGLVSEFDVVAADGNEMPYVNADNTPVAGNVGATITNTGTWMDPDGDAVTLSASVGTVVKDPGGVAGTWSWTFTVTAGASRLAFITATDAGGHKNQTVFALDLPVAPSPPLNVNAAPGTSGALVSFSPPLNNGGTAITSFTATCVSSDGGTPGSASDLAGPIVVDALTSGKSYACTATATNAMGTSVPSAASNVFTPLPPPPVLPGAVRAVAAVGGNGRATLRWLAPTSNGGAPINGYVVTPFVRFAGSSGRVFNTQATTQVITGLTNGKTYHFKVAAKNSVGTGAMSPASNAIVIGVPGQPSKPTAKKVKAGSLKVSFVAPANNGAAITSFTAACKSANGGVARSKAGKAPAITMTGLAVGKTYTCTVKATNSRGTGLVSKSSSPVKA